MAFEYHQDLDQDRFLPASLEDRLVAVLARLGGAAACALLAACWVSLITWSTADPSLTQANGGSVRNLLGMPGAVTADLLLQTFGFAAVVALLAPTLWAVELFSARRIEAFRTKITYYPLAVLLLAGALSSLPVVISWPLHNDFGGILGDGLYGALRNLVSMAVPQHSGLVCSLALFVLGGISLCYAGGGTLRSLAGWLMLNGRARRQGHFDGEPDRHFDERPEPAFGRQPEFEWDRNDADPAVWREEAPAGHSSAAGLAGAMTDAPAVDPARDFGSRYEPGYGSAHASEDHLDGPDGEPSPFQPQFEPAPLFIRKSVEQQRAQTGGAIPHASGFVAGDDLDFDRHTDDVSAKIASRFAPNLGNEVSAARKGVEAVVEAAAFPDVQMPPAYDTRAYPRAPHAPLNAAAAPPAGQFVSRGSAPWGDDAPRAEMMDYRDGAGTAGAMPAAGPIRRGPTPGPMPGLMPGPSDPMSSPSGSAPPRAAGGSPFQPKPGGTTMMAGMKFHPSGPPAYRRPSLNLLKRPATVKPGSEFTPAAMRGTARLLEDVLADFGIKGEIRDIKPGPVVTLFEFEPARGVKSSRVIGLADDIARSMSATSARIGIVPGRNVIGIELPNSKRETVLLRELFEAEAFRSSDAALPIALGKAIGGDPIVADLARMPHLLVAGTTGSGKSVGVNAMILSLLYRYGPEQCRFLMIDPKMLELSIYNDIPHLLCPVVTDANKAVNALNWVVGEMEERYKRMSLMSVRNVDVFNNRVHNAKKRGEMIARTVQTGFDRRTGKAIYEHEQMDLEPMPYIVVVIDEFADLMSVAGKDVETAVQRLAQMARASGIHLIMATQRPSVDVITGTIKANFPTRISFKVASKVDSRTILNEQGAEQLLGLGDMLYSTGSGNVMRVHGPFVADEEVEAIAKALRESGKVSYVAGVTDEPRVAEADEAAAAAGSSESDLYDRAVAIVLRDRKASTSYLQRRLAIGYNRAADLIERMERDGLISPPNGVNKREILAAAEGGE